MTIADQVEQDTCFVVWAYIRTQGFVVGYHGSKIFCLNYSSIFKVDVPQVCVQLV